MYITICKIDSCWEGYLHLSELRVCVFQKISPFHLTCQTYWQKVICACVCSVVSNSFRPHGLYSLPGSSVHAIFRQEYWSGLLFPTPGYHWRVLGNALTKSDPIADKNRSFHCLLFIFLKRTYTAFVKRIKN